MDELNVYEVEVKMHEAEHFLSVIQSLLEKEGYETKVHLHEPPQQMEIFEFVREEEILSVQIDRMALDKCVIRASSEEVDPRSLVLRVICVICTDLVANFLKPMAGEVDREKLEVNIGKYLEELVSRKRKG